MDDVIDVLTFPNASPPNKGQSWPDDVRGLAFELWYTDAGRKLSTLEKILSAKPYELPVPYQTLWHWHRVGQWDIEADKRMAAFAPHRRRRSADLLVVAAEGMASYLAQVSSGAIEPTKEMTAAAKVAMDAAGFASVRVEVGALPAQAQTVDLSRLSDDELARLEREG